MALNMHIKIAEAEGESVHKGNEKEIEVLAWSWGLSQAGSAHVAKGAGTGKVNIQDLSFTHYVDSATPKLMGFCCSGARLGTVGDNTASKPRRRMVIRSIQSRLACTRST